MPKSCSVSGCLNNKTKNPDINFYVFPKEPTRRQKWISKMSRALVEVVDGEKIIHREKSWEPSDSSYVCSDHFVTGEYPS